MVLIDINIVSKQPMLQHKLMKTAEQYEKKYEN